MIDLTILSISLCLPFLSRVPCARCYLREVGGAVLAALVVRVAAVVNGRGLRGFTAPAREAAHRPGPDQSRGRVRARRPQTHRALCLGGRDHAVRATDGVAVCVFLSRRERKKREATNEFMSSRISFFARQPSVLSHPLTLKSSQRHHNLYLCTALYRRRRHLSRRHQQVPANRGRLRVDGLQRGDPPARGASAQSEIRHQPSGPVRSSRVVKFPLVIFD